MQHGKDDHDRDILNPTIVPVFLVQYKKYKVKHGEPTVIDKRLNVNILLFTHNHAHMYKHIHTHSHTHTQENTH